MNISEFAERVGLSKSAIYKLVYSGYLKPLKTPGGHFRFTEEHVRQALRNEDDAGQQFPKSAIIYARVSTSKQKQFLDNQIQACKQFAINNGFQVNDVIADIASSFNFKRKGLDKLLKLLNNPSFTHIIVYSKDRLSRIAFELFEKLAQMHGKEIIVIDKHEPVSRPEQKDDLMEELINFIHYITSKIYGSRSYRKRIEKCIKEAHEH